MAHPRTTDPNYRKTCSLCGIAQPAENFHSNPNCRDGLQGRCKGCQNDLSTKRYRDDPEAGKARHKKWAKRNRRHVNAYMKRRRQENPKRFRDYDLKKSYGLAPGEYDGMLAKQEGRCAICGTTEGGGNGKHLNVDHCHETGQIHGLLCSHCNNGIGRFRHDTALLLKAISYLEVFSQTSK